MVNRYREVNAKVVENGRDISIINYMSINLDS